MRKIRLVQLGAVGTELKVKPLVGKLPLMR